MQSRTPATQKPFIIKVLKGNAWGVGGVESQFQTLSILSKCNFMMLEISAFRIEQFRVLLFKRILLNSILTLSIFLLQSATAYGQTYESKSCGACGKEVSINSRVGQRCPHCGVKWGRENTNSSYRDYFIPPTSNYDFGNSIGNNSFSGIYNYGMTKTRCNVRLGPSKNYQVIDKLDGFQSVEIIDRSGSWYQVEYYDFSGHYNSVKKRGWVHSSLIQ